MLDRVLDGVHGSAWLAKEANLIAAKDPEGTAIMSFMLFCTSKVWSRTQQGGEEKAPAGSLPSSHLCFNPA